MKYARRCSITAEGMNDGWVWGDGEFYSKYESDTMAELRRDFPEHSAMTDDELMTWAVEDMDFLYWTEWEDKSEYQYKMMKGILIEIQ